jgi:DNA-binding response OmpR family regulator
MERKPTILWIHHGDSAEFAPAESWLRVRASVQTVANLPSFLNSPPSDPPDAILLAQSRPGESSTRNISALRARYPLTPIIALVGSWCEGDHRHRGVSQGVPCIPWHAWPVRLPEALDRLFAGKRGPWSLPLLSSEEERLCHADESACPTLTGLYLVRTRIYETWSALADLLSSAGASAYWLRSPGDQVRGAKAILWDIARGDDMELDSLAAAKRRLAVPIVALASFPRVADIERIISCETASVIAKPFAVDDLLTILQRLDSRGEPHPSCGRPHLSGAKASIAQTAHFVQ